MRLHRILARRLRHLFRRGQAEAEMREEMNFHLEQRAADYAADGAAENEARQAAQRRFGNTGSLQERARDAWGWGWLERAWKDVRFALRQLTGNPGFTVLAILTLGLGIGATTSMFSILNHLLLRPLPYPHDEQLVRFFRATPQNPDGQSPETTFSAADWLDFQRAAPDGFGEVAAYNFTRVSLSEPGQPAEMAFSARSSVNFFSLLGVTPQLGRDFRADEGTPGRDHVVILSQRTWINRFDAKPDIIGRTIRIDGEPHEIIGVMSQEFNDWRHLGSFDFFRPLVFTAQQAADRQTRSLVVNGRRAANRSPGDAASFVANFGQRLAAEHPVENVDSSWRTVPLRRASAGKGSVTIVPMLIGLSAFVLLIACSNLANLLLARTMTRAREFAVRGALGASRTQLLRPLIMESLLLALAGGGLALLVALWFRDWAAIRSMGENREQVVFKLDWLVTSWTFGACGFTALAFGLAPALFALRLNLNETLKSGGRGATGGLGHQRFRQILIVGQFALAMIMLTGAGIFIRGLYELNTRRSGWNSERLITASVALPVARYGDGEKINAFHRLALEQLAALPGVTSVSISSQPPFFNWTDNRKFLVEGRARPEPGREPAAMVNAVSPRYFETYGTRLLAGRDFNARDTLGSTKVFILSQNAAKVLFGNESPLGKRIAQVTNDVPQWGEIVGVVGDVQSVVAEVNTKFLQIYQPMAQDPRRPGELAVRTSGVAPTTVVDRVRATMTALDPDLPLRRLQPADLTIFRQNYQLGVLRDVLTGIALLGLGLAALGIYGVISRTMAQRKGEFAIRLALGASIAGLTRMILASGVKLALVGSALGLVGAFGVAKVLGAAFPNMHTNGLPVQIAVTLLLVSIALVACWLPARRAGKIDAMSVLRAE